MNRSAFCFSKTARKRTRETASTYPPSILYSITSSSRASNDTQSKNDNKSIPMENKMIALNGVIHNRNSTVSHQLQACNRCIIDATTVFILTFTVSSGLGLFIILKHPSDKSNTIYELENVQNVHMMRRRLIIEGQSIYNDSLFVGEESTSWILVVGGCAVISFVVLMTLFRRKKKKKDLGPENFVSPSKEQTKPKGGSLLERITKHPNFSREEKSTKTPPISPLLDIEITADDGDEHELQLMKEKFEQIKDNSVRNCISPLYTKSRTDKVLFSKTKVGIMIMMDDVKTAEHETDMNESATLNFSGRSLEVGEIPNIIPSTPGEIPKIDTNAAGNTTTITADSMMASVMDAFNCVTCGPEDDASESNDDDTCLVIPENSTKRKQEASVPGENIEMMILPVKEKEISPPLPTRKEKSKPKKLFPGSNFVSRKGDSWRKQNRSNKASNAFSENNVGPTSSFQNGDKFAESNKDNGRKSPVILSDTVKSTDRQNNKANGGSREILSPPEKYRAKTNVDNNARGKALSKAGDQMDLESNVHLKQKEGEGNPAQRATSTGGKFASRVLEGVGKKVLRRKNGNESSRSVEKGYCSDPEQAQHKRSNDSIISDTDEEIEAKFASFTKKKINCKKSPKTTTLSIEQHDIIGKIKEEKKSILLKKTNYRSAIHSKTEKQGTNAKTKRIKSKNSLEANVKIDQDVKPKVKRKNLKEENEKSGWLAVLDMASSDVYYYNKATGETTWEKPKSMPEQKGNILKYPANSKVSKEPTKASTISSAVKNTPKLPLIAKIGNKKKISSLEVEAQTDTRGEIVKLLDGLALDEPWFDKLTKQYDGKERALLNELKTLVSEKAFDEIPLYLAAMAKKGSRYDKGEIDEGASQSVKQRSLRSPIKLRTVPTSHTNATGYSNVTEIVSNTGRKGFSHINEGQAFQSRTAENLINNGSRPNEGLLTGGDLAYQHCKAPLNRKNHTQPDKASLPNNLNNSSERLQRKLDERSIDSGSLFSDLSSLDADEFGSLVSKIGLMGIKNGDGEKLRIGSDFEKKYTRLMSANTDSVDEVKYDAASLGQLHDEEAQAELDHLILQNDWEGVAEFMAHTRQSNAEKNSERCFNRWNGEHDSTGSGIDFKFHSIPHVKEWYEDEQIEKQTNQ